MSSSKPRVFVSSVMRDFEPYRTAAREGVRAADGIPVMAEDWPSLGDSSRTACLDLVASSDALVLVVGERGGWRAPSGLLVVEEELREARRRKLPVRVFVQEGVERDADAERLVSEVSDYVEGYFRRTFTDPGSLAAEVQRAVADLEPLPAPAMPTDADADADDVRALALAVEGPSSESSRGMGTGEKTLRFVLAPERAGEVIDPRRLDEDDFHHAVMTAAQHPAHRLLEYGQPVVPRVRGTALVLERTGPEQNWRESRPVRIEMHEHGLILIDAPVEAKPDSPGANVIPQHVVSEERVEHVLTAAFRFSGAVYELVDEFHRFGRFKVDVALGGAQGAVLERSPQPRSNYTVPWRQPATGPVVPLQAPRVVNRHDLGHPGDEVSRLLTYLRRKLSA